MSSASSREVTAEIDSQACLAKPDTDRSPLSVQRRTPPIPPKQYGSGSITPRIKGSPERLRRNSSGLLISVPEDSGMDFERQADAAHRPTFYTGGSRLNSSDDDDDDDEDEVEEWLIEEELAKEGLYRGSYRRIVMLYSLTPISTILTFVCLACFPIFVYPLSPDSPHSSYPYSPYLPYPFPELLTAAALWSLSQLLRESVSAFSASIPDTVGAFFVPLITTLSQTLISIFLKLSTIVLLLIAANTEQHQPTWRDHSFRRVWAVALGWAGIEAIVGIKQGYEHIALYHDVLVTVRRVSSPDTSTQALPRGVSRENAISMTPTSSTMDPRGGKLDDDDYDDDDDDLTPRVASGERQPLLPPPPQPNHGESSQTSKNAIAQEVENDLEQLMALKAREELEEIYGMPVIYIPVFISCMHRINAVLLSLGNFLLISGAYLRSSFVTAPFPHPSPPQPLSPLPHSTSHHPYLLGLSDLPTSLQLRLSTHSNTLFGLTLLGVTLAQLILVVLHSSWVLPRIGIHTFVYVSCLISLGMFFAGLGYWEALV
ncbi:hypothetical protein FA15DRAFT_664425 [Coprinopsis marcescibilis]|uniref:Transmembrane protein n=1 Tax=Coprinopsis marcescibilis TaxID=230819 RepID=A0A5C3L8Y1_COPMA|nr:hypothetical protein FA15DRAFT_664425 [Coprinopsis marcescibilis]